MSQEFLTRVKNEWKKLQKEPPERWHAAPLRKDKLNEWHFTVMGPHATDYEGGIYHGRLQLPKEYPWKPPAISLLSPTGRFEVNKKICLSISHYHPESWTPTWGIRTVIEALVSYFPAEDKEAKLSIGAENCTAEKRRELAKESGGWKCDVCQKCNRDLLAQRDEVCSGSSAGVGKEGIEKEGRGEEGGKEGKGGEGGKGPEKRKIDSAEVIGQGDNKEPQEPPRPKNKRKKKKR